MIEKVFSDVHRYWGYRILFFPMFALSLVLLLLKLLQLNFAVQLMLMFLWKIEWQDSLDLSRLDLREDRIFFAWLEVVYLCYLALLVRRSFRVMRGKPFYLQKTTEKVFFRYPLLAKLTTVYMGTLGVIYLLSGY